MEICWITLFSRSLTLWLVWLCLVTLFTLWIAVACDRLKCRPISGKDISATSLQSVIATWRANASGCSLDPPLISSSVTPQVSHTASVTSAAVWSLFFSGNIIVFCVVDMQTIRIRVHVNNCFNFRGCQRLRRGFGGCSMIKFCRDSAHAPCLTQAHPIQIVQTPYDALQVPQSSMGDGCRIRSRT